MRKKSSSKGIEEGRKRKPRQEVQAEPLLTDETRSQATAISHRTTVSGVHQQRSSGSVQVPCIRIIGKWLLNEANFKKGDKLEIEVSDGKLSLIRSE